MSEIISGGNMMKKFVFLFVGFIQPTPVIMESWMEWIKSVEDKVVEMGGFCHGKEVSKDGVAELPMDESAITSYMVFSLEDFVAAEKIAQSCPMISSVKIYEVTEH